MSETKRSIAGRPADETLQQEVYGAFGDTGATIEELRRKIDTVRNNGLTEVEYGGISMTAEQMESVIRFLMAPSNNINEQTNARNIQMGLLAQFKQPTRPFSVKPKGEKPLVKKIADAFHTALKQGGKAD